MTPPLKTEGWTSWWMPWLLWTSVGILVLLMLSPILLRLLEGGR